ncbi:MAG: hypothetical protein ABSF76_04510 [Opitutaceae bacterium]|jgi:hypothetical protein
MRSPLVPLALFCAAALSVQAADLKLKRVWPEWYSADSFQSFYEYHTGRELTGRGMTVLRSIPGKRAGLYFMTRIENPGAPQTGATLVLRVISPESTDTRVFTFPASIPSGSWLFQVGLTGKDWAGPHIQPVAWEIEVHGADGGLLAKKSSFLWEKPGP